MDDYYNNRPQQVPGAQKKRTSLYDVDASKAEGVEVFENPLRAKAAAKAAQSMSTSVNDDVPTIVPTFPTSKFVVEEETSHNYMEEGSFFYFLLAYLHTNLFSCSLTRLLTRAQALIIIPVQKLEMHRIELVETLKMSICMTIQQTK